MPRDPNQLAKMIAYMATGEAEPEPEKPAKNPATVALGRLGGAKGGKASLRGNGRRLRGWLLRRGGQSRGRDRS